MTNHKYTELDSLGVVPTGIAGFDQIAHGGIPQNRTTLIGGTAGSGKTLFALQFLANGVEKYGENGVLVTFEEDPEDLVRNVQNLDWHLDEHIDDGRIAVVDVSPVPGEAAISAGKYDLSALISRIEHAVRKTDAKRAILDSVGALFPQVIDSQVVRHELHRLVVALRAMGVTSLITVERADEDGPVARYNVEEFVADNVMLLRNRQESERRRRTVEIVKIRGADHLTGEFPFTIDLKEGLTLSPLATITLSHEAGEVRISSGIGELDKMCHGGPFQDSIILVSGATGTGKTLMASQFMKAGIAAGERTLLLAFEESEAQLVRNAAAWGIDYRGAQEQGHFRIVAEYPENRSLIDHLVRIKQIIEEFKPTRVAVDSLSALERVSNGRSFREFVLGITSHLKSVGAAGMFTNTTDKLMGGESITETHISTITDSIIILRYVEVRGEMRRGITVLKMRGSYHDNEIREYVIGSEGMHIREPFRNVTGILSGSGARTLIDDRAALGELFPDE
ncbi:MAG: circadian clock protein KaiC [Salinisphaeraceae bacterium]|nr:circadian clock protein KaiC [Salinisphaeraceae bacterium]